MCKRDFCKIVTLIIFLNLLSNCISIPINPKNEEDECVSYFYHHKRRMREIQIDNRNLTLSIVSISFATGFIFGLPGLLPIGILPFTQYKNYKKSKVIQENYEELHCNKNFE